MYSFKWAPSSEFVSSNIPSWQILTAHAQPFRGARDLAFCLKVPLDSLLVWASSGGSGETARMRRLAWTFAARIGDKDLIRLTRSKYGQDTHFYNLSHNRLVSKTFTIYWPWKLGQGHQILMTSSPLQTVHYNMFGLNPSITNSVQVMSFVKICYCKWGT